MDFEDDDADLLLDQLLDGDDDDGGLFEDDADSDDPPELIEETWAREVTTKSIASKTEQEGTTRKSKSNKTPKSPRSVDKNKGTISRGTSSNGDEGSVSSRSSSQKSRRGTAPHSSSSRGGTASSARNQSSSYGRIRAPPPPTLEAVSRRERQIKQSMSSSSSFEAKTKQSPNTKRKGSVVSSLTIGPTPTTTTVDKSSQRPLSSHRAMKNESAPMDTKKSSSGTSNSSSSRSVDSARSKTKETKNESSRAPAPAPQQEPAKRGFSIGDRYQSLAGAMKRRAEERKERQRAVRDAKKGRVFPVIASRKNEPKIEDKPQQKEEPITTARTMVDPASAKEDDDDLLDSLLESDDEVSSGKSSSISGPADNRASAEADSKTVSPITVTYDGDAEESDNDMLLDSLLESDDDVSKGSKAQGSPPSSSSMDSPNSVLPKSITSVGGGDGGGNDVEEDDMLLDSLLESDDDVSKGRAGHGAGADADANATGGIHESALLTEIAVMNENAVETVILDQTPTANPAQNSDEKGATKASEQHKETTSTAIPSTEGAPDIIRNVAEAEEAQATDSNTKETEEFVQDTSRSRPGFAALVALQAAKPTDRHTTPSADEEEDAVKSDELLDDDVSPAKKELSESNAIVTPAKDDDHHLLDELLDEESPKVSDGQENVSVVTPANVPRSNSSGSLAAEHPPHRTFSLGMAGHKRETKIGNGFSPYLPAPATGEGEASVADRNAALKKEDAVVEREEDDFLLDQLLDDNDDANDLESKGGNAVEASVAATADEPKETAEDKVETTKLVKSPSGRRVRITVPSTHKEPSSPSRRSNKTVQRKEMKSVTPPSSPKRTTKAPTSPSSPRRVANKAPPSPGRSSKSVSSPGRSSKALIEASTSIANEAKELAENRKKRLGSVQRSRKRIMPSRPSLKSLGQSSKSVLNAAKELAAERAKRITSFRTNQKRITSSASSARSPKATKKSPGKNFLSKSLPVSSTTKFDKKAVITERSKSYHATSDSVYERLYHHETVSSSCKRKHDDPLIPSTEKDPAFDPLATDLKKALLRTPKEVFDRLYRGDTISLSMKRINPKYHGKV